MASPPRRYTFLVKPVLGAICFLAVAATPVGPAGADAGRFSLSGFDRIRFGTRVDRVRKLYPRVRPAPDATRGEAVWRLPGTVRVAGIPFTVRLVFNASRLSEVTYVPRNRCRGACLRAIRLDLEARLGRAPEVLDDEAAVKTWLWVREVDGGAAKLWISVMVNFEPEGLIEISVSDQTDQQIMPARGPVRTVAVRF